jgi:hypothetical protein
MVWNITQDAIYATALEEQYQKRMSNLRHRSEDLEMLSSTVEGQIGRTFAKAAPIWAHHRKGIDRVEAFLFGLLKSRKLEAHHQCFAAWGQAIHAKPSSLYELLYIKHMPVVTKPESHCSNPAFSSSDSFSTLNAYLAIDPMGCLDQPGLLSTSWVTGLSDPGQADAAVMAVISSLYRYGDQKDRISQGYGKGRLAYGKELLVKIGESAGKSFNELIESLPETKKSSPPLAKFYRDLIEMAEGTPGMSFTYMVTRLNNVMPAPEFFNLAMKARLFGTTAHDQYLGVRRRELMEQDATYFHHCIESPYVTAAQLKVLLNTDVLDKEHIQAMHNKGIAIAYLNSLDEESRYGLIEKGLVPITMLSRAKDRGHFLENAMGL